jgi:hypothetical protein
MTNSKPINYLRDFGFISMTKFRSDLETFHLARIKENGDLDILETVDNYLVPIDQNGNDRKVRPVKANQISLPESTIEGESQQRTIIGDPVTLAFDLLKKAGIEANFGIFKYEKKSKVNFRFENIICEAIALDFDDSQGSLDKIFKRDVPIDGIWYRESLRSYILKSSINYKSKLGRERIEKFVEEITVDNTYEAKSEKTENENYPNKKNQKKKPKYYIISTVLKSNKFRVSFYDFEQNKLGIGLTLPQSISLKAGYQVSHTAKNTLEYTSDENYLAFGIQLIPFYFELRGPKSMAKPFLKLEFDKIELTEWTGEIFDEKLNSKLKNSIEPGMETWLESLSI